MRLTIKHKTTGATLRALEVVDVHFGGGMSILGSEDVCALPVRFSDSSDPALITIVLKHEVVCLDGKEVFPVDGQKMSVLSKETFNSIVRDFYPEGIR